MRRLTDTTRGLAFAVAVVLMFLVSLFGAETALAQSRSYEVTITNLTRDQQFTPILIATHDASVELGSPASAELESLAETGNTAPLTALLTGTPGVLDVGTSSGLLAPGASVTVQVQVGDSSSG